MGVLSSHSLALTSVSAAFAEKGSVEASDVKIDPIAVVGAALGGGGASKVGQGVSNMTMKPIVGQTMEKAGAPTAAGLAAGAAVEGAIMGTVDSISQEITPIVNDVMDLPSGESLLGF